MVAVVCIEFSSSLISLLKPNSIEKIVLLCVEHDCHEIPDNPFNVQIKYRLTNFPAYKRNSHGKFTTAFPGENRNLHSNIDNINKKQ